MKSPKISDLLIKISGIIEDPAFPSISKLERDLLKQHIRNLYEEISSPDIQTAMEDEPIREVPVKRPVLRPNDNLLIKEEVPVRKEAEPVKKEVITVTEKVTAKPETKVETRVETKVEKPVQTSMGAINDNIKPSGSLNEKLKTSSVTEVHKKLASKPLKELIDLNKKFVLLNELFKGNTEAYSAAIAHIDSLNDHESAQSFINTQLHSNYVWDDSKQSTRMFYKLVRMKFGLE